MSTPPRTRSELVQNLLGGDYDAASSVDLSPYVASASAVVDRVNACANKKGTTLSGQGLTGQASEGTELELIERWLAAHMYCLMDPTFQSKSTGGASGSFTGQTGQGFDSTRYGLNAQRMDYSGCLRNIDKQQRAGGVWLGKPVSSQVPYDQRN